MDEMKTPMKATAKGKVPDIDGYGIELLQALSSELPGSLLQAINHSLKAGKLHNMLCRFLILLVKSWRIVVISGTVHWLLLKTSFHPLLWTSSGLTGSWKTKHLY